MKILIVSDTHRRDTLLMELVNRMTDVELLIHLGDSEGSEDSYKANIPYPVEIVSGNNDFFSELDREKEMELGKYKIFLTHGHYYNVSLNTHLLESEALTRGCQIAMFGHTHRPYLKHKNGLTLVNPGSLSLPRQEGHRPSYIIMDIDKNEIAHFTINYL